MNELRKGLELDIYNGKMISFEVSCFERFLHIILKDTTPEDIEEINSILLNAYYVWLEDDDGYCCEEYLLYRIRKYEPKIVAVIYDYEEEEEDEDYE